MNRNGETFLCDIKGQILGLLVLVALRISKIIVPPFPSKQPTWLGETKPFTDSAQIYTRFSHGVLWESWRDGKQ
jgi:hypothetical protein